MNKAFVHLLSWMIALGGGVSFVCSGCNFDQHILELNEFQDFSCVVVSESSGLNLYLHGWVMHSAWGIAKICVQEKEEDIIILVSPQLASSKHDGNLHFNYIIPSDIKRVKFGKSESVIWQKEMKEKGPDPNECRLGEKGPDPG